MMSASEAHATASLCQGEAFQSAVVEQRQEISEIIEKATRRGLFTYFYTSQLYPEIKEELTAKGYKLKPVYTDTLRVGNVGPVRVFNGYNITW